VSTFQIVCLNPFHHQVVVVLCVAHLQHTLLLNQHLSSLAEQAAVTEEPFTTKMVVVKVFCMKYVDMIVSQHTQIRIISLRTYK
jgi:hypothetical protein